MDERCECLYQEAKEGIILLEKYIPNLYTAEGLYRAFEEGFFTVPYMVDSSTKYSKATQWRTAIKGGGIRVVNDKGEIIHTSDRYRQIILKNGQQ